MKVQLGSQTYAGYAKDLTEWLYDQYGIENHHPTVMRHCLVSHQRGRNKGDVHQIVYAWQDFVRCAIKGYDDYKSIMWVWGSEGAWGLEAIHRIVLHEFAHVIQAEDGKVFCGSVHNEYFVEKVQELLVIVPFEEFGLKFIGRIRER